MRELDAVEVFTEDEGRLISAKGVVPHSLELFADHFPDFPVLPGVLALEILKRTMAAGMRRQIAVRSLSAVRFHGFLRPGDVWNSEARRLSVSDVSEIWHVSLRHGEKSAVSGRLEIFAENMKMQEGGNRV